MGEITTASQQQSAGIEQINQAVAQMEQVTQQNAALVEEASAAAQSLQDQSGSLSNVVSVSILSNEPDRDPMFSSARQYGRSTNECCKTQSLTAFLPVSM